MSRRKTLPVGEPSRKSDFCQQATIIFLKEYRKLREKYSPGEILEMLQQGTDEPEMPPLPECAVEDGQYIPVRVGADTDQLKKGDILMFYVTKDVRTGDFACFEDGQGVIAGTIRFSEAWVAFEWPCECRCIYRIPRANQTKVKFTGRLVEVQRRGKPVKTSLPIRPLYELATVYQFKRRA